ncbi:MAG TPA: HD-GYP domain-containing protein [Candidatus Hydrogenedentes bacterium]|nr:HD-GYP domain-containing protein [Candidatus Hydrogenedentota bacterium]
MEVLGNLAKGPAVQPSKKIKQFFPIFLTSLRIDTLVDFDLYIQNDPKRPPVLYRNKNLAFTESDKQRLGENAVTQLFVPSEQEVAYFHYVEANLSAILSDANVKMDERSEVLYNSAMHLVQELLDDPRSKSLLPRSKSMVQHSAGFIFNQEKALQHLIKVTSYDYYTYTHSVNVLVFSIALCKRLGYSENEIHAFGNGALLHDVGKSMIDPAILNTPGKLTKEQFEIVKQHPVFGENILRQHKVDTPAILDVVRHHHEKRTGKGYPDGLPEEKLSEFVRISTIADIFDALTTRRPYKDAMGTFDALKLMKDIMAEELDQRLFQTFVGMMGNPNA